MAKLQYLYAALVVLSFLILIKLGVHRPPIRLIIRVYMAIIKLPKSTKLLLLTEIIVITIFIYVLNKVF